MKLSGFATLGLAGPIAGVLMLALPMSGACAQESEFFLQNSGKVRVIRGLDESSNFEAATLPEEAEEAPAAAPPRASPPRAAPPPRLSTRQAALERARDRGITVHRAGVRNVPRTETGVTRQQALERSRARGVPTNPAGG